MPFVEREGLRFFQFEIFPPGVAQAVFTRRGGQSLAPWDSLNVGGTVGDDPVHVRANRLRSFAALERPPASLFDVWQVHSADWVYAAAPRPDGQEHARADIILTDRADVTLFMRFADCVPVLLCDPTKHAIALAHAGWQGTVRGAAQAAVQAMVERFGSRPADLLAAIGPSIGPDHYQVGADVIARVRETFGAQTDRLVSTRPDGSYLDLWAANRWLLERSGVTQIEVAGLCTACHLEDWFSHRAEHGRTGRFGVLLGLS